MLESIGIGNELNRIVDSSMAALFGQGELAQLSHTSFDHSINAVQSDEKEVYTFEIPIGYQPSKEPLLGKKTYTSEELIERYTSLAHKQIPINGIYQLVTIIEAMLSDIIRRVITCYPEKIGIKRQISIKEVLRAESIEELHLFAASSLLHELSYKSPREYAVAVDELISVNLLECPAFHVYIEMKASRDVLIHNRGIANEIYLHKAESHARVKAGKEIPVDQIYFLEVYEACLQFVEWFALKLHDKWHSSEFELRRTKGT
jgi:hypothetical protein